MNKAQPNAHNATIGLDQVISGIKGGGINPPPSPRSNRNLKRFYLGFQVSLFRDNEALKLGLKIKIFRLFKERLFILKWHYDVGNPELTPKLADPDMLVSKPIGKIIEPEDMNDNPEFGKLIEPEDM